jgi:hypothetical protein
VELDKSNFSDFKCIFKVRLCHVWSCFLVLEEGLAFPHIWSVLETEHLLLTLGAFLPSIAF